MSAFTANIARFCDLARRGSRPGASSGERTAYHLAKELNSIGDDMMILDAEAIEGFTSLCQLAHGPFENDDQKTIVFDTISRAAGL